MHKEEDVPVYSEGVKIMAPNGMKKFYFTISTVCLFDFLRDIECMQGVKKVDYELQKNEVPTPENIDGLLWHVEMEVEMPFNIGILITLAYLTESSYIKRYSTGFKPFKISLLRSSCQKYSISRVKISLGDRAVSELKI